MRIATSEDVGMDIGSREDGGASSLIRIMKRTVE